MRRTASAAALLIALAACETTNSKDWTGTDGTPFAQAERTCFALLEDVTRDEARRDFFIACMRSLGWAPRPGASIDIGS